MAELFIDSAAIIAEAVRRDTHHVRAMQFLEGLPRGQIFHLSNYIVDETLTRLLRLVGLDDAVRLARDLKVSRIHTIHQITEDIQEDALEIFSGQGKMRLSFTDCTSVALMRRLDITDIFTFDRDFTALGLTVRP